MNTNSKLTKLFIGIAMIVTILFMWGGCSDTVVHPIQVSDITVTGEGNATTVLGGSTLQMIVDVLPLNASDTSVTWSVIDKTGTATISSTGLLTGTSAGIVKVIASSNDASSEEGSLQILVNGQPYVSSLFPLEGDTGVSITTNIEGSFNEIMDPSTLTPLNVIVGALGSGITGAVSYSAESKTVSFNPDGDLLYGTEYTVKIKQAVTNAATVGLIEDKVWTFTTTSEVLAGEGPAPINLRTASNFSILAKSAITTTGNTLITGDIGVSPQSLADVTGFFSEILALDGTSATSSYVTGNIYTADMQEPTPSTLTTAISDIQTAYVEAAGRVDYAIVSESAEGIIGGQTFALVFINGKLWSLWQQISLYRAG